MRFPTGGRLRGCLVHSVGQDVAATTILQAHLTGLGKDICPHL
jgi:hypothetical protein